MEKCMTKEKTVSTGDVYVSRVFTPLAAIDLIVSDDFMQDMELSNFNQPLKGGMKIMYEKLSAIYRIAHSFNPVHMCHDVHENWRQEAREKFGPVSEPKTVREGK